MSESFELKVPETVKVSPESLIRVIAKTLLPTIHPEDAEHTIRVFEEAELILAARSLALKPVGLNHQTNIPDAIVVNSDWNKTDKVVEAILSLPPSYIKLIENRDITQVSVDYNWDSVEKQEEKSIFKGLKFLGISLLHGVNAGDPNAKILFESQTGKETMEITVKGEPFAGYKDFADCVAKNQQARDPEAYCAAIKAQAEAGKSTEEIQAMIESGEIVCKLTEAAEIKKLKDDVTTKDARIKELETAVANTLKANEDLKTAQEKAVKDAKNEGIAETKKTVLDELTKIIPDPHTEWMILKKTASGKLLCENIKKVKRKVEAVGTAEAAS